MTPRSDLDLVRIDLACSFVFDTAGRIKRTNAPDATRGPRLYLSGCRDGNVLALGHDVSDAVAREIESLATDEPPLATLDAVPRHLDRFLALLGRDVPVEEWMTGPRWVVPDGFTFEDHGLLVRSGSAEGDALVERLREHGMTPDLRVEGFHDPGDFWPPWCALLDGDEVASICFAARLGSRGAEAGVTTMAPYRGRGFATAATAGWATHPELRRHALFYSTSHQNVASQHVAQRLGLRFLGSSLRIM